VATYHWYGADSGNEGKFETAANWYTPAGVVSTEYPGQNQADNIVFDAWAAHAMDAAADLDQSANPNGIEDVTFQDSFGAYAVGTRKNPLYLKLAATPELKFNSAGAGDIYLVTGTTAVTACNVLRTGSSDDALHLVFSSTICTLLNVTGGTVVLDSELFGVASLGATTFNIGKQAALAAPNVMLSAPVATLLNNRGGNVDWLAATIADLKNYDGTFRCAKSTAARTLTASTIYGGVVDFRTGVPGTLTLTAAIAYLGGEVRFDYGENLQRS